MSNVRSRFSVAYVRGAVQVDRYPIRMVSGPHKGKVGFVVGHLTDVLASVAVLSDLHRTKIVTVPSHYEVRTVAPRQASRKGAAA